MARYIGATNSSQISLGGAFSQGNKSVDSIYNFLKDMAGVTGSAPGIFSLNEIHHHSSNSNWSFDPVTTAVSPVGGGGTLTVNGNQIGGSVGWDYTVKIGNQTVSSYNNTDWFTSVEDTRIACIHVKGNLTIDAGQTFIPSQRKLGTYIYVSGDLILNGEISMRQRGANHSGSGNSAGSVTKTDIRLINGTHGSYTNPTIPSTGMVGGARGQSPSGANQNYSSNMNTSITAFATGGGQHGIAFSEYTWAQGGKGGDGTSFGGGSGGGSARGAGNNGVNLTGAGNATENGGPGGNGTHTTYGCSGSAGNPGGSGTGNGATGNSGTGGVVVIFVEGTVSGSGNISVRGEGLRSSGASGSGPGQGSAAGMIAVFCNTNSSSVALYRENGGLFDAGGRLTGSGTDGEVKSGLATNSSWYPITQGGTGVNYGGSTGGFGEIITSL